MILDRLAGDGRIASKYRLPFLQGDDHNGNAQDRENGQLRLF